MKKARGVVMDYREAVNVLLANALCGITDDGCPCDICPAAGQGEDECNCDYKSGKRVKQAAYFVNFVHNQKAEF